MENNNHSYNLLKKFHLSKNKKNIIWWLIMWILLLNSCQKDPKENIPWPQRNNTEIIDNTKNIKSSWEYKVYNLWFHNIAPVKRDIQKAKMKIANNDKLSKILSEKDTDFETIIPKIIKESKMNNNEVSKSWAVWYLQLLPKAIKDVENTYDTKDLNLNAKDPVDNIIIWCLYRKRCINLNKKRLDENTSNEDLEKIMIISYNIGPTETKRLFIESKAKNYKEFEKYLAKKIWIKWKPVKRVDKDYHVEFMDPLVGLDYDKLSKEDKKIAEGLRYVATIEWISSYLTQENTIQILWKIICDKENTLFTAVKKLKEQWIFKKDAPINKICKIILDTNWYSENNIPEWIELLVIKNALKNYLP